MKNSSAVIKWFKNIQNKNNCSFIVFHIENVYLSISLTFFNNAILSKKNCDIPDNNILITMHARYTVLSSNEKWVKKDSEENFNVPINYNDWLKIFELIGTYLLYKINNVFIVER